MVIGTHNPQIAPREEYMDAAALLALLEEAASLLEKVMSALESLRI